MRDKLLNYCILVAFLVLSLQYHLSYKFLSPANPTTDTDTDKYVFEAEEQKESPARQRYQKTSLVNKIYPDFHICSRYNKVKRPEMYLKNQYWVVENYIQAVKEVPCDQTITYTTHGEYHFLDNLVILIKQWQGPISVAVYAPGTDFEEAVKTMNHLRHCVSDDVRDHVTFHLFFDVSHLPLKIRNPDDYPINCQEYSGRTGNSISYRSSQNLTYPVNVARNLARTKARTYFVLASDIELFPSLNVIPEFLKLIQKPDYTNSEKKRVFVLPVFEIKENQKIPQTKNQLLSLLEKGDAHLFHEKICKVCHMPPKYELWKISSPLDTGLSVSAIGKRTGPQKSWEPFYIGTNKEPLFDERLTSEGRANKMTQAFAMCLQDYEYHVLDRAFLVHKPGIKTPDKKVLFSNFVRKQNELIFNNITKEYRALYGYRKGCQVMGKPRMKEFKRY